MLCTEAYKEHIMYMFNGFFKTAICFVAINAWHDRSKRRGKLRRQENYYSFAGKVELPDI